MALDPFSTKPDSKLVNANANEQSSSTQLNVLRSDIASITRATESFFTGRESDGSDFLVINVGKIRDLTQKIGSPSHFSGLLLKNEMDELYRLSKYFDYLDRIFTPKQSYHSADPILDHPFYKYYEPYHLQSASLVDQKKNFSALRWISAMSNIEQVLVPMARMASLPSKTPLVSLLMKIFYISMGNVGGYTGTIDLSDVVPELRMNLAWGIKQHITLLSREFISLSHLLKRCFSDFRMRKLGHNSLRIQQESLQQLALLQKIESQLSCVNNESNILKAPNALPLLDRMIITKQLEANLKKIDLLRHSFLNIAMTRGMPISLLDKVRYLFDDLRFF